MKTYFAFLRGINVSGHKKIPMAELRELLSKNGLKNVQTYIQTGNVIFKSSEENTKTLALKIHEVIKTTFGFEVPTLVITPKYLQGVFDACPFPEEKKVNSYFTFLYSVPERSLVEKASEISYPNEEFVLTDQCIYFYSSIGYGNAKYSNNFFERKLKTSATARNYKTIVKLLSLST